MLSRVALSSTCQFSYLSFPTATADVIIFKSGGQPDWKKREDICCLKDWLFRALWGPTKGSSVIVLWCTGGLLIRPPWCRETLTLGQISVWSLFIFSVWGPNWKNNSNQMMCDRLLASWETKLSYWGVPVCSLGLMSCRDSIIGHQILKISLLIPLCRVYLFLPS